MLSGPSFTAAGVIMLRVSTNEVFVEELSDQGGWVCVQNIKLEQCHSFALSQKVI